MTSALRCRRLLVAVVAGAIGVTGAALPTPPADAAVQRVSNASALRVGVLALVASIAAVGQTPALATDLPFTTTSLADVLDLDRTLSENVADALQGTDLETALAAIDGVTVLDDADPSTIAFTYDRTVTSTLELVHDDGDLRFGPNDGAGSVTVSLTTRDDAPFEVAVDPTQTDPLLRVALVNQPRLDLSVDVDTAQVTAFPARQGFTEVAVEGGHYRAHRDQVIDMRDPDGRSLLTLEDLRYSTLPDLFRVTTQANTLDIGLDLASRLAGRRHRCRAHGHPDARAQRSARCGRVADGGGRGAHLRRKARPGDGLVHGGRVDVAGAVHRHRARAAGRGRREVPQPRRRHPRPLLPGRRPPRPARHGGIGADRVRRVSRRPPDGCGCARRRGLLPGDHGRRARRHQRRDVDAARRGHRRRVERGCDRFGADGVGEDHRFRR